MSHVSVDVKLRQKWNNSRCQSEFKKPIKHCSCEEDYAWNLSRYACECDKDCEIGEYLKDCKCIKSFGNDLLVTCNEITKSAVINIINRTNH